MPDNKSISQLTTAEQTTSSDLFETSIPNGSLGYLSRKVSLDSIADYIGNDHLFSSDLQTTDKTLTGAINEAAQSGGGASIQEMTQAQYNALTPEQKADGTLRAISDAKTSIGDIDDVNISAVADGDILAYDSSSSKWVNKDTEYYHVGDVIDISAFVLSCYATTTRLDLYVALQKKIPTGSTLTIAGNWRIILTNSSTLASNVVLNNAALSTIGTVSATILEGGLSIRVALNSGVVANWSLGNAFAMGSNSITIS